MNIKESGQMIRELRNRRNMTQGELADEICSTKEIYRIEKGEVAPRIDIYEKILLKLSINPYSYIFTFISENDKSAYIMMREIEELGFEHKYEIVEEKLTFFLSQPYYNKDDNTQKQFTLMIESILFLVLYNKAEEAMEKAVDAINITLSDFNIGYINSHQLNLTEYQIINTMALIHINLGEIIKGIDIFKKIKISLCNKPYLKDFKNKLLPTICYNLSKYLGKQGDYIESIAICDEGIEACVEAKTFKGLSALYYNKACCLYNTNNIIDAENCFNRSYMICLLSKDTEMAKIIKENAKTNYGILIK